ncbi:ANKRD17 [Symbiodinium natans]|uniref:ANKRD17 protein n=1 Tax=Symbiodinium natans TaxID=878477 RepID=A0A812KW87_9DINO|nr:ANKRD17 [Symbiodinium natans]
MPPRFRQRLIRQGADLDDADEFDSALGLDLHLILQPFASAWRADELVAAVQRNSAGQAGVGLRAEGLGCRV